MRLFVVVLCSSFAVAYAADGPVRFNRDIRPIMSDTCFRCHGPDKSSRMAGMRLDIRDEALKPTKSGAIPIVPGDPDKSAIVQRVFAANPGKIMPPKYAHKDLTDAQKQTIRRWVAEGAVYEGHWSFQPVTRPQVPAIQGATVRNPIDAFIQERLAQAGLKPSPVADPRTLIRRVTLDLTGLPPTPEDVAAFVRDPSDKAYGALVDRLLASPAYAERQAMFWLDAVRYADSAGFHGDNLWPAWPYRDYVLAAFRDDKPFDVFTREQIAGDLFPNPTREQLIATAFNRLNRASAEGGIQPKEYIAKYGADRVRTISTAWMGTTMGCAECHDHKFDPITSKDFYSMKAFFADIKETGLVADRGANAWGAKLVLGSDEQKAKLKQLEEAIAAARTQLQTSAAAMISKRIDWEQRTLDAYSSGGLAWVYQRPTAAKASRATLTVYNDEPIDYNYYLNGSLASERKRGDGLVVASGENPDNETYSVSFKPGEGVWTSLGIDVHQDESLPGNRVARGADRFVLTEVEAQVSTPGQPSKPIRFVLATSTGFGESLENPAMAAIDGDAKTGWGMSFGEHRNPFLALRLAEKLQTTPDSVVTVSLHHDSNWRRATIGRFRVALSPAEFSAPETGDSGRKNKAAQKSTDDQIATLNVAPDRGLPPEVAKGLEKAEADRSDADTMAVLRQFEWSSPDLQDQVIALAKLEAARDMLDASIPRVLVTERMRPRMVRILPRGDFLNESGEMVTPAVPAYFGKTDATGRATRMDLANWLVSTNNPLTARAYANRKWREFFGIGLSKVLEDLGSQGEWPTHPELLDWLAAEFMQPSWQADGTHAWDVKHLIRTIVTSHTYMQSSTGDPAAIERDPDNRLLAHQSRFRVEAETVHDIALSVSGLLVDHFGGPSVKPAEPAGYLGAMNFPKREYSASHGPDEYRRALYTEWQRTFLHPSLLTFDAPTREECTVNRVSSNTPLQALVLLNDPIFVEAARAFASEAANGRRDFAAELDWIYDRALSRPPSQEERKILSELYQSGLKGYRSDPRAAAALFSTGESQHPNPTPELAALTLVTRAVLNAHETITRN
jgi:hypothetical protein